MSAAPDIAAGHDPVAFPLSAGPAGPAEPAGPPGPATGPAGASAAAPLPSPSTRGASWRGLLSRRYVLVAAAVAAGFLGLYLATAVTLAGTVPRNTTVAGVDISGRSTADAVQLLDQELGPRAAAPLAVAVESTEDTLDPVAAGLGLDAEATVAGVSGFSLSPVRLWRHLLGAGDVAPELAVDRAALDGALAAVAERTERLPVEGNVVFPDGVPTAVEPVPGFELDSEGSVEAVLSGWLRDESPLALPTNARPVVVDSAAVEEALATGQLAVAEPLVVVVGPREVELEPTLFGQTLEFSVSDDNALVLGVKAEKLRAVVLATDPSVETPPRDAEIVLAGGSPSIVEGVDGSTLDPTALADATTLVLTEAVAGERSDRRVVVESAVVEPAFTTADAEALGVNEVVSSFSTPYPSDAARTQNLRTAAAAISGTLVRPGETFSLNGVLGRRTIEKGYRPAGLITNGRFREGVGGGVSQIATTVYNAAHFAGMTDIAHRPHSYYISRYPEGRESTLNWDPVIDMDFRNDTETGILVQASVSGGQVTVTFWGTKTYEVESIISPRRNTTTGTRVVDRAADCVPQAAITGFTVDVTRILHGLDGAEVSRETNTVVYNAGDEIVCEPDQPEPDPATPAEAAGPAADLAPDATGDSPDVTAPEGSGEAGDDLAPPDSGEAAGGD